MEASLCLTILTIFVFWGFDVLIKAEDCDTSSPVYGQCKENFVVNNGKVCYYGDRNTFASISCGEMYTFDTKTTFECTGKSLWTPTATAKCSLIGMTSTLTASSTFGPSKNSMISTAGSGSSLLMTSTVETNTEFSSHFQTTPSLISPSSATGHSSMSPSMTVTLVVSSPAAASQKAEDSGVIAAYIATPVALLLIALLLGVIWWRRRNYGPSASIKKQREPGALITNETYAANAIDRHCSLVNVRQSRINEYAEITLDKMDSDMSIKDDYQTIDSLPGDNVDLKKSYTNFKPSDTKVIDANYSHIGVNKAEKDIHSDKLYAHIPLADVPHKPEKSSKNDDDDTYNKLNTTTPRICEEVKDNHTDTEYNQARSGIHYSQHESDNYSHITSGTTTREPSINMIRKYENEDGHKNNFNQIDLDFHSDLTPLSKTQYELRKDSDNLKSTNNKAPRVDDYGTEIIDSDKNQLYETAKEIPTEYDFAKDFDNLTKCGNTPAEKKLDFNKTSAANNGYETAVGTTHNYLIFEPDTAANTKSFHVVEDELDATEAQKDERKSHEYFILEKTDT